MELKEVERLILDNAIVHQHYSAASISAAKKDMDGATQALEAANKTLRMYYDGLQIMLNYRDCFTDRHIEVQREYINTWEAICYLWRAATQALTETPTAPR